ncbi:MULTISPECIES: K+/H+ antiporter subunit F [unclassified Acidovorax]|uniref:K+/H+ antiporter subunit F n=1 Tax=unclassified Acidovorax TaxID=2684926 RepID=UPI000B4023DE|nr:MULTISPECIES: K+/H+ antiporter subunit F [unclassified Acidovorax]MBP3981309.1 K+/H+ antiporter subunit F [Acidovorax sp. JG5]MBU4423926.1 K+/H+ antiporter subunit F [Gammaproteobacteria bacterium]
MNHPVLSWALPIALCMLVLAMVFALVRLLKGPSAQDRVLALDCMYLNGMLLALVLGIHYGSSAYFEGALLIALFSFVGTTAMAKFLLRGEVIE